MKLLWSRQLPAPQPAWPDTQWKLQFDASYEPIVLGDMLYVGSMVDDTLRAYNTADGAEKWRFYAEGPIRLAPVGFEGKIFCLSDDGHLYCLDAATGKLLWKFRAGGGDRRGLGNGRLISLWPARGGLLLDEGKLYFTAGLWPFMGTFIYCMDARTGKLVWTNSGNGQQWSAQPHGGALSFSGIAPQGYLAAAQGRLIIPNSRNRPAIFDQKTGQLLANNMMTKQLGGWDVYVAWGGYYNAGQRYTLDGNKTGGAPGFLGENNQVFMLDIATAEFKGLEHYFGEGFDKKGKKVPVDKFKPIWLGKLSPMMKEIVIRAGDKFYGPGPDGTIVSAVLEQGGRVGQDFTGQFRGKFHRAIAADGKLFVVTREGGIYCYGAGGGSPITHELKPAAAPAADPWTDRAKALLAASATEGYALVLGAGSGRLVEELVRQSKLHVVVIEPDAAKADAFRRRMSEAGLYGPRVAAIVGNGFDYDLSPYFASLIASEDVAAAGFDAGKCSVERLVAPLRPYGGVAVLPGGEALAAWARGGKLDGASVDTAGTDVRIRRSGALPGAGEWTHQYADASNSVVGAEQRVAAPLGLLWFGSDNFLDVLPRHGHGPNPQVAGGRLFIEGINMISARDVYTGRVLWQRKIEGFSNFGMYWDKSFKDDIRDDSYNQGHIPGANQFGSNYAVTADRLYLINGPDIVVLDAATGKTAATFKAPARPGCAAPNWGVLMIVGDVLVATTEPMDIQVQMPNPKSKSKPQPKPMGATFNLAAAGDVKLNARFGASSRNLVALDRNSGKILWQRGAAVAYRHNAVTTGAGKVFALDNLSEGNRAQLTFIGQPTPPGRLVALDLTSGKEAWSADKDIFGTWLGYSSAHDVLLQCGSGSRDRAGDEAGRGIVAYRGADGGVLWQDMERKIEGPVLLWRDRGITNGGGGGVAFLLKTGQPATVRHPVSGQEVPWAWHRFYGCNTAIASQNMMFFRSGTAGYYDLVGQGGTGNFGGFKSGCTSNLIAADGVLSAPDYTRTCSCSYPLQASLALVHMPEAQMWTYSVLPPPTEGVLKRIGLNLGAPGDRLHEGTLWLEYPPAGSPEMDLGVDLKPGGRRQVGSGRKATTVVEFNGTMHRQDPSTVSGSLGWVASSVAEGIESLSVRMGPDGSPARPHTVRLVFAEMDDLAAGQRVFDVIVQGKVVRQGLDVAAAAGGPKRSLVVELKNVSVSDKLTVEFKPRTGKPILSGLECVEGQ
ncbi:MAG: PQQ-binding-like beta-propeller repeat protein [Planctomycetaceae bacterium]|nr:PQQ-binding-like beta-propeller repeat protein [Planctomycetaceae bacterium]